MKIGKILFSNSSNSPGKILDFFSIPLRKATAQKKPKYIDPDDREEEEKYHRVGNAFLSIGKDYENTCQRILNGHEFGFDLKVVGGSNDQGVDLEGRWKFLQDEPPVIVQCKRNHHRKVSIRVIRELEGSLERKSHCTIGMLITSTGLSNAAYSHLQSSRYPLVYGMVISHGISTDYFMSRFQLNKAMSELYPHLGTNIELVNFDGTIKEIQRPFISQTV